MKRWKVMLHGDCEIVEAETKEEAKKIAGEKNYWVSQEWLDKLNAGNSKKYRIIVKEDKRLCGWDLIDSLGCSKYD